MDEHGVSVAGPGGRGERISTDGSPSASPPRRPVLDQFVGRIVDRLGVPVRSMTNSGMCSSSARERASRA